MTEAIEHQAPQGTFTSLTSLEKGILGNPRTKRFIRVMMMPRVWPLIQNSTLLKENMAVVEVRIRTKGQQDYERDYFFGIDPRDRMTLIASYEAESPLTLKPIEPPTPEMLLQEVEAAQKIQSTLRHRI